MWRRGAMAIAVVAALGAAPLGAGVAVGAPAPVTVGNDRLPACAAQPSATGYCTFSQGAGRASVVDDARAEAGRGYLRLDTPGGGDKATVFAQQWSGRKLSDITDLEYRTLIEQTASAVQAPSLNIQIAPNKAGETFSVLVWEPVYTGATLTPGTWQAWAPSSSEGGWWATRTEPVTGQPNKFGFNSYTATFAEVKAALPDAVVGGIGVNQGSGNPGLRAGVDLLRINDTTVDFDEPVIPTTLAATGGDGQRAVAGDPFAAPLQVTATGAGDAPAPDRPVTFTVTGGSASFGGASSAQATTDARGVATSPTLVAGDAAGPVTVTATTGELTRTFRLSVIAREADLSAALSAPATARPGTSFPVTLTVRNAGPIAASRVTSAVTLPFGLRATQAPGGRLLNGGQQVAYSTASIAPDGSVRMTLTVTADRSTGTRTMSAATRASVPDPRTANNTASARTTIR